MLCFHLILIIVFKSFTADINLTLVIDTMYLFQVEFLILFIWILCDRLALQKSVICGEIKQSEEPHYSAIAAAQLLSSQALHNPQLNQMVSI